MGYLQSLFGRPRTEKIEAVITVNVDGSLVRLTGTAIEDLATLFNKNDKLAVAFNIVKGTGHKVAKSINSFNSDVKLNFNASTDLLSYYNEKVEYVVFTGERLHGLLTTLVNNEKVVALHQQAKEEELIRHAGDVAYREGLMLRAMGRVSYSPSSFPEVRRLRTEQAYRQIINEGKRRV